MRIREAQEVIRRTYIERDAERGRCVCLVFERSCAGGGGSGGGVFGALREGVPCLRRHPLSLPATTFPLRRLRWQRFALL